MSQFHLFKELPQELQDMIWDATIRDGGPGAHFFTIYDAARDPNSVVSPAMRVHATNDTGNSSYRVGFAAPQRRGTTQQSWVGGNTSTYLIDSGLWTTCWNSRLRMMAHFRPDKNSPHMSWQTPTPQRTHWDNPMTCVSMEFQRDNGEHQALTIRPSADLLCLQLAEGSALSWDGSRNLGYIAHFPLFRWRTGVRSWHPVSIGNIAIEYSPAWEPSAWEPNAWSIPEDIWGLFDFEDMVGLGNFWLVDYSLSRRYNKSAADRRGRRTFRAAGGLEFVEVLRADDEWSCHTCFKGSHLCRCVKAPYATSVGAHGLASYLDDWRGPNQRRVSGGLCMCRGCSRKPAGIMR